MFKNFKLKQYNVDKIKFDYNPVHKKSMLSISNSFQVLVPKNLKKPCIVRQKVRILSDDGDLKLKVDIVFRFKVSLKSKDMDVGKDEVFNYLQESALPEAYEISKGIIYSITETANINSIRLPEYKEIN